MSRSAAVAGLVCVLLLLAACGAPASPTPSADVSPSGRSGTVSVNITRLADMQIVERDEAAIEIAFDTDAAAALVAPIPANADFAVEALLCLFIGRRDSAGWSVALQSIRLVDGRMEIAARETEPRLGTIGARPSYPADCVLIDRSVLPVGPLPVTSTDTTSDEFIVDGVIDVPAPSGAP